MMPPVHVVTVEDDARYRASLEMLLRHSEEFTLAGSFGSARAALGAVDDAERRGGLPRWELVLMDLELPDLSGIETTRRIKERVPGAVVVVLTVFEDPATVVDAICAGADGYLLKRVGGDELLEHLRAVLDGGSPLTAGVARTLLDLLRDQAPATPGRAAAPTRFELTEREQEVLRCLVDGMAYKQIAAELGISIHTVREYIRRIYRKLQVHSVAEAVRRAVRRRIV